jgi:hypothetical protein
VARGGEGGGGEQGGGGLKGGEMTQTLYAHMNKKKFQTNKQTNKNTINHIA